MATKKPSSFNPVQVFGDLAIRVAGDPELLDLLEHSFIPKKRDLFTACLQDLLPQECRARVKDVYSGLSAHCKWVD